MALWSEHPPLTDRFTVGNGENVSFAFDVTVVKREDGYLLKPHVGESGTHVEMCRMHDDGNTSYPCGDGLLNDSGGVQHDTGGMENDSDGMRGKSGGMDGSCHG